MQALRRQPVPSRVLHRCLGYSSATRRAVPFTLRPAAHDDRGHGAALRLVVFGKPGSGKGTLSSRLVKKYAIESLSTGDLLRQHISERTEIGRQAEEIVSQGKLLGDEIMLKLVASALQGLRNKHWILDGFPRTGWPGAAARRVLEEAGNAAEPGGNFRPKTNPILRIHFSRYWSITPKQPNDRRVLSRLRPSSSIPHQLTFASSHKLLLKTISGRTSDEIWPQLEGLVRDSFPALKERADVRRRHSLSDAMLSSDSLASATQGK
ncbi:adenylate kinase [Mycena kentingensis (nom. inval.)]|nr:adenylate kinase [Mycena kentingensis (nom. inval.)]